MSYFLMPDLVLLLFSSSLLLRYGDSQQDGVVDSKIGVNGVSSVNITIAIVHWSFILSYITFI